MPIKNTQKRGRPAKIKTAVKSKVLGLRFTASENTRLQHAAYREGKLLSQWAKEVLLGHSDSMRDIAVSIATKISQGHPDVQIPSQQRSGASLSTQATDLNSYMLHFEKFVRSTKSTSTKESISDLHSLIQMNRRVSKYLRMAALNTKTIAAISALYEDCVDTCHFLAKPDIASQVTKLAGQRPSFPVAVYAQPLLNNRIRGLLNKIKPGAELHGLRQEAKWVDTPFVREALGLLDHTNALIFALLAPPMSQANHAPHSPDPIHSMPNAKDLVRLHKIVSTFKSPKTDQNELWRIVDTIVVGKERPVVTDSHYRYDWCWEDMFNSESLSKLNGNKLKRKEIKNHIKRAFLTLYPIVYS